MRVMGIVLLLITLAGCTGDRTKQAMKPFDGSSSSVASWSIAPIINTSEMI
jgi:hypothetical protein